MSAAHRPIPHDTRTYDERRGELKTYFDRTAVEAWKRLTSDAPVGRIRRTVRAGRDTMRSTMLDWLPVDLRGRRVLDAGCGTGALAVEAARRGADVVAIDLSPTLVDLARERTAGMAGAGSLTFLVGDMLDPALGGFDHVIAMDSLIHYRKQDVARVLDGVARRTSGSIVFTFAPRTALLTAFWAVGRAFPRSDRAPALEPVAENDLRKVIAGTSGLSSWKTHRTQRVASGFYTSQAMELVRS
jgi:magnesium-protoporphyrin O-methyltransferase